MAHTGEATDPAPKNHPLFRYDLETTLASEDGQTFVDVLDPKSGTTYRFYEVEYAVACGMNGERDLNSLVSWAKSELELATSTAELGAMVSKLRELHYLESVEHELESVEHEAPVAPEAPEAVVSEVELGMPGRITEEMTQPAMESLVSGSTGAPAAVELGEAGSKRPRTESGEVQLHTADVELGEAGGTPQEPMAATGAGVELGEAGGVVSTPPPTPAPERKSTFKVDEEKVREAILASKRSAAAAKSEAKAEVAPSAKSEVKAEAKPKAAATTEEDVGTAETIVADKPVAFTESPTLEVEDISAAIASSAAQEEQTEAVVLTAKPSVSKVAPPAAKVTPKEEARPVTHTDTGGGTTALWIVLLIVTVAAVIYYYMEVIKTEPTAHGTAPTVQPKDPAKAQGANSPSPAVSPTPAPTEAPAPVAAPKPQTVLVAVPASSQEAHPAQPGFVAWINPEPKVSAGDALVKLRGHLRFERAIERHTAARQRQTEMLSKVESEWDPRRDEIQAVIEKKDALIKQANEKLEILTLRAPKDGVANIKVAVGDRVTEESVLATMEEPGGFTAIFTLPEGAKSIVVDSEVEVVAAAEPERKSTCRITSASDSTVTATCPSDSALKAGDKVELQIE